MKFTIITLFPNVICEYISTSIISKAQEKKLLEIDIVDLRKFGVGKRCNVDDTIYGGGDGMLITAPVLDDALSSIEGVGEVNVMLEYDKDSQVKGVIVIAEGGKNPVVANNLSNGIATLYDIPISSVIVFEKEQGE